MNEEKNNKIFLYLIIYNFFNLFKKKYKKCYLNIITKIIIFTT